MKQITQLLTFNNPEFWKTKNDKFGGIAPVDHLFNRLDGIYVGKWRAAFSSDSSIKNWRDAWAEAIAEENLSVHEIQGGLTSCRRSYDWPPSFPEFLKACRPSVDYENAYIEAVEQIRLRSENKDKWTSPAIYWAAVGLGNDLTNFHYQTIKERWKSALDKSRESIALGKLPDEVPERKVELPAPGKITVSKEESARRFEKIKNDLSKKISSNKDDSEPKINDGKYF